MNSSLGACMQNDNTADKHTNNTNPADDTDNTNGVIPTDNADNSTTQNTPFSITKPQKNAKKIARYKMTNAGIAENLFQKISRLSLPILLLLTIAICFQQVIFIRDFLIFEEVHLADVYMNMLTSKEYFHFTLNGMPYAETLPLFFWGVMLIDTIPHIDMPQAFFLSTAFFTVLFLTSTWVLARGLGYSKQIAFASGLIILSTFSLVGLNNYICMDLLFASFINISILCFYRAWRKKSSPFWLTIAFIFMAFAVMTQGLFAFTMPLAASLLFLIWIGKAGRLNKREGLIGFILLLCIILSWISYLVLHEQNDYINTLIHEQISSPLVGMSNNQPPWFYLLALPILFAPWISIILFANWFKAPKNFIASIKNRTNVSPDVWLLCVIIAGGLLLSYTKEKIGVNLIPLLPAFAILTAKILLQLSPIRTRLFFGFLAIIIFFVGAFLILFEFHTHILDYLPLIGIMPDKIPAFILTINTDTDFGIGAMGALCIILALILGIRTRRKFAGGSLLVFCLGSIIAIQPFLVAPKLEALLSPKNQAERMAEYKLKDYIPVSYQMPASIYTYYYNMAQNQTPYPQEHIPSISNMQTLLTIVSAYPKVIVAMPVTVWETLENKNGASLLQKQWLGNKEIALILWHAPQSVPFAPLPPKPDNIGDAPIPQQMPNAPATIIETYPPSTNIITNMNPVTPSKENLTPKIEIPLPAIEIPSLENTTRNKEIPFPSNIRPHTNTVPQENTLQNTNATPDNNSIPRNSPIPPETNPPSNTPLLDSMKNILLSNPDKTENAQTQQHQTNDSIE